MKIAEVRGKWGQSLSGLLITRERAKLVVKGEAFAVLQVGFLSLARGTFPPMGKSKVTIMRVSLNERSTTAVRGDRGHNMLTKKR